ncbi:hypothetical protein F4808DRAFT_455544 [Astrocystis sublimbata]|nr:hypothetical protein F4808DRAFT_455544 [Astrocystis sublimbata]
MASAIKSRVADRGSFVLEPSILHAFSFGGSNNHASGSGSTSRSDEKKVHNEPAGLKPWADQPWPLILLPSQFEQITHSALYIANEIAHIHNAMLRGLNAIYLQAPYVHRPQDITDLSFLAQSWSTWLLDHHDLKEREILPGFEAVLGIPVGTLASTLTLPRGYDSATASDSDKLKGMAIEGDDELLSVLLHRVYAYASTTYKSPQAYDAMVLCGLLEALADVLVPHLTSQVGLLISMREMCFVPSAPALPGSKRSGVIRAPMPMPMATIPRTTTTSVFSPPSPSPSSMSGNHASALTSTPRSPPTTSLSLFPPPTSTHLHPGGKSSTKHNPSNDSPPATTKLEAIDTEARARLSHARALLEADDRATRLTQVYLAADARASAAMDPFVMPPMMVRLRDITAPAAPLFSRSASRVSLSMYGGGGGIGASATGEWPRLSIPAVHAIADKLSLRHEGAWRLLPCDVWGRPRDLPFLG